jgi:ribonucleoside-diphosphate reductase alpha subunit
MEVIKRNGQREAVSFDKVLNRITKSAERLHVNPAIISQKVLVGIKDGIHTQELDELTMKIAISLCTTHPDYAELAVRIAVSNHQKNTKPRFCEVMRELGSQRHPKTGEPISYVSKEILDICDAHEERIEAAIRWERDEKFDFFGFKTLEKQYLLKDATGRVLERPQHLWMRVALAIWGGIHTPEEAGGGSAGEGGIDKAFATYDMMSMKLATHATPTLFNAGTPLQQLSSCFLLAMHDDSIKGIYKTLTDCALISKNAGGIGLHVHNVRAQGSLIRGTNGVSNGIVPMLRNFNATARYVDQGGGKRNGSFAIYLEPWHADIEDFLKLKLNQGAEEERARDLFYGLWMPDLFMKRVEADGVWTLFCPNEAPGLADLVGHEFELLYTRYEKEGRGKRTVQAQKLWFRILDTQIETGTPYLLYKDAANLKSNQQNLGVIKSSNLCTEVVQYSSPEETAVCNLASLALPAFVNQQKKTFNFAMLRRTVRQLTQNLNRVIDINYYPTPETRTSNMRHRPIGIGVQGLADVFAMMRMPWEGELAADLNQRIFEHIYYAALEASADIAQGAADSPAEGAYSSFVGSPIEAGKLQPDFWFVVPLTEHDESLDWTALRAKAQKGIRNSLLVAPMPTASTSQILGYTECFEPVSSNIYTRRTLAGEFIVVNKYLLKDLMTAGIWSEDMKQKIIMNNGSIQGINEIPEDIQQMYKTSYEIKQRTLIDMAAARGAFICQSQSLNLFVADPTYAKLSAMHFYSWKKGLKTGIYYLRSKAPVMAQKFTVDPDLVAAVTASQAAAPAEEGCLLCSA